MCSLKDLKFLDSNLSCLDRIFTFSTVIRYAAKDGSRTASDVVSKLFYDLGNSEKVWIGGETSLSLTSAQINATNTSSTMDSGLFIAIGFVAGVVSAVLILVLLILL